MGTSPGDPRAGTCQPLLSCIRPTGNRADFALQAVSLFQRQDYEQRELVILDDRSDDPKRRLPEDGRLRYVRAERSTNVAGTRREC